MQLELAANPGTIAGLSRLKPLTATREGRLRTQAVKILWHDSPDHELLADGMTLAEQRGVRHLERLFPGAETWLPAQPAPVLTETDLPSPMAPVAAFEGRQTVGVHLIDGQSVTITVLKGILRSVTAEHPIARLWLDGEDQAVRAAAIMIAAAEPIQVPIASLAAEAIALATGRPATIRHHGAPVLPDRPLSVSAALAHILGHLTDVILANATIAAGATDAATEAVHQMRVAVRRARSALSIFRTAVPQGALDPIRESLRTLGGQLGPIRDWDVFAQETVPAVKQAVPNDARLERLAAAVERRRREHQKALAAYLKSPAFRLLGIELAWFAAAGFWHAVADPASDHQPPSLAEFAGPVLQHRSKKLISLGKRIEELDLPSLHMVRLRAKRSRYAAEMFAPLHAGKLAHRFIDRLTVLQQRLGVLNDGAVAQQLLAELGGPSGRHAYAAGIVVGFLAARAEKIRPRIIKAFDRFRRQPAYWT